MSVKRLTDITPVTTWAVAPIPDPVQHPTHTGGILIPLRWPHHGDLRIIATHDTPPALLIAADDLHALAEYDDDLVHDAAALPHPTIAPTALWARHDDGSRLLSCYTFQDAVAVLEHAPTHATGGLLAWMREQIPFVVRDEVLDAAIRLESFLDAWTVGQAALILDRDPQVSTGRTRLFATLDALGWIIRDHTGHWVPTSTSIRTARLTIRTVTIRTTRGTEPYEQLYVTQTGLDELRQQLHALNPTPAPVEQPTLPLDL